MEKTLAITERALKNYDRPFKELYEEVNYSRDEVDETLEQLGLDHWKVRNDFYWKLQAEVEQQIYEHMNEDDSERLAELITETWNEKSNWKLSPSIVLQFLYDINFKFPNSRKAYTYICDGDLASYQMFDPNTTLFSDHFLKFVIYHTHSLRDLQSITMTLLTRLFPTYKKEDFMKSIRTLGFYSVRNRQVHYGKVRAYKDTIEPLGLPTSSGFVSILQDAIKDDDDEMIVKFFETAKEAVTTEDDRSDAKAPESHEGETKDNETIEKTNEALPVATTSEPTPIATTTRESPEHGEQTKEPEQKEQDSTQEVEPTAETEHEKITQYLTEITKLAERASEQLTETKQQSIGENEQLATQLKIANDENEHLKKQLAIERKRITTVESDIYKKIFSAIGGEDSNYLLSDLFEESEGKLPENKAISSGRLVNLFSTLSIAIGLEQHTCGFKIGEKFSINKDDLIKKFRTEGPLQSESETQYVQLTKYGWTINGEVIVEPLVKEVKEEQ